MESVWYVGLEEFVDSAMSLEVVFRSMSCRHVFRFTSGSSNRFLFASAPGYCRVAEFEDITREASPCVEVVSFGGVRIAVELKR